MAQATLDGQASDTKKSRPTSSDNPFPKLPVEFGRYRVLKLLGRGGMGAVYLAQDSQLGRQVALKIPFFDAAQSQRLERFAREARSAAALEHPNICTIYDAGKIDGRPFITMAHINGTPLEQELHSDEPITQTRAAEIVRKIALALDYAHRNGIVHRDLKPANVMMRANGEPVVMDFGLAKQLAEVDPDESKLTGDGRIVGTPSYMPPEQVNGDSAAIGPATDVYALGVVLFELVTGTPPYTGSFAAVMGQILAAPVPALREFRPDADPQLEAVCLRAMAKAPADRFHSMAEMAAALDECVKAPVSPTVPVVVPKSVTRAPTPAVEGDPFGQLDETTTPTRVSMTSQRPSKRSNWKRPAAVALAFLLPLVVWIASVLLRVETPNGTLIVEIDDPAVEARIKDGKLILSGPDGKDRYSLSPGERDKKIDVGAYKVRVEGADGLVLDTPEFTLKKGDKVTLRVTMDQKVAKAPAKKDAVVLKKEPKEMMAALDPDRKAAEYVISVGGKVRVNSGTSDIEAVADLPPGAFRLTVVNLHDNLKVTEAGLASFRGCKHITDLGLANTPVRDSWLEPFKDCKSLQSLGLLNTKISDEGLSYLKDCKDLVFVNLHCTQAGNGFLAQIGNCENIKSLTLDETFVTDDGLAHLKKCKKLEFLALWGTQVGDKGLLHLKECTALTTLTLQKTKVTAKGVEGIKKALPGCDVAS